MPGACWTPEEVPGPTEVKLVRRVTRLNRDEIKMYRCRMLDHRREDFSFNGMKSVAMSLGLSFYDFPV